MKLVIPDHIANQIFDILIEKAGATERWRQDFVYRQGEGCVEYRFQGGLGFGGKFYNELGGWRVSCYPEDVNEDRRQVMSETNHALFQLFKSIH